MDFCDGSGPLEFADPCVRALWGALIPALLVLTLFLFSAPISYPIHRILKPLNRRLQPFLTPLEAEALGGLSPTEDEASQDDDWYPTTYPQPKPPWRTIAFIFVGILKALYWLVHGVYLLLRDDEHWWNRGRAFVFSAVWLYTAFPNGQSPATPPFKTLAVYLSFLAVATLELGGILYDNSVYDIPLPSNSTLIVFGANLVVTAGMLIVILGMPLAIPSIRINKGEIGRTISPEDYTTLWGWITFCWIYPLIRKGRHAVLNEDDVWNLSLTLRSRPLFSKFSQIRRQTRLGTKLLISNSSDLIIDFLLTFASVFFNYAGPFFLKHILDEIDHESSSRASKSNAYIYAFLAFICAVVKAQLDVQRLWCSRRAATRARSVLMAAVYDKALKRKDYSGIVDEAQEGKLTGGSDPQAGADVGKIVNLMSVDANTVSNTIAGAYFLYSAPIEIIIAGVFLYRLLGWSAFAGLLVLAVAGPLSILLAGRSIEIQKHVTAAKDKRMSALNELITAIKFVKFFAQEYRWIKRVLDARDKELYWLNKARSKLLGFHLLWSSTPILVSIISFWLFVAHGHSLSISTAFTAITLFNMIQQPLGVVPATVAGLLHARVALKRISVFLDEEEVSEQTSSLKKDSSTRPSIDSEEDELGFVNASFKWNKVTDAQAIYNMAETTGPLLPTINRPDDGWTTPSDSAALDHQFELRDLNIRFPQGKLTIVMGPTGSGKTALLMALLGEMTITNGRILMRKEPSRVEDGLKHSISYAPQVPWLRQQSIRDNILFGSPYDEERYDAVIEACALKPDLELLEDGDQTEIGTRGVTLSGGQRTRVVLARAVYARTKYVLLDDPLSAVDTRTARYLYDRLLRGPLLANRTVILVTRHVQLVHRCAYYVVQMLDGKVDRQDTVEHLLAEGVLHKSHRGDSQMRKRHTIFTSAEIQDDPNEEDPISETAASKLRRLLDREPRETAGIKWAVYKRYLSASSYWPWIILAILLAVKEFTGVGEKLWVKTWGEASGPFRGSWPKPNNHPYYYIAIYTAIGFTNAVINVLSITAQYTGALQASRVLFKQLLVTIVRATFRFHDTTPQGRILNLFSKDMDIIDNSLASSLQAVNSSLVGFIAAILTVCAIFPGFLIPAFVIGFAYRKLAVGYLGTSRDLRRMQATTKSPIFSDFSEVVEGIVTIRAFSAERMFLNRMHENIDVTTKMWYSFWMANRWLLLNFDCLGALGILITTLFAIPTPQEGAAWAAVSITSAMAFGTSIYWGCRFWTDLELDISSVERVVEYLDLPPEPPTTIGSNRAPAYWPSITSDNPMLVSEKLTVKYAPDLPPALHDVSFTLQAGERVGLLGRTGSGKSTFAMSIMRFVDPTSGRIKIDGIDISTIGIHDLRTRITFIPQDTPLFSGTLRTNLDPFNDHTDQQCLDVLQRVQMIGKAPTDSHTPSLHSVALSQPPDQAEDTSINTVLASTLTGCDKISLDTQVAAGGTNFSQGQKQLISLARALLRRSSIIVMDESTCSVDPATDAKIRQVIREEFRGSLLLTVAHRLKTVIDYDRLIVLDKGRVVELDTPWNLIQKEGGVFRDFCLKSGSFSELEAIAKAKAENFSRT